MSDNSFTSFAALLLAPGPAKALDNITDDPVL